MAIAGTTAPALWRGITIVFYSGAVAQFSTRCSTSRPVAPRPTAWPLDRRHAHSRARAPRPTSWAASSAPCSTSSSGGEFGRQIGHATIAGIATLRDRRRVRPHDLRRRGAHPAGALRHQKALRRSVLWLLPLLLPALDRRHSAHPGLPADARTDSAPSRLSRRRPPTSTWSGGDRDARQRTRGDRSASSHRLRFRPTGALLFPRQGTGLTGDPHNSYVYLLAGGGVLALGGAPRRHARLRRRLLRRLRRAVGVEQSPAHLVTVHMVRVHGERVLRAGALGCHDADDDLDPDDRALGGARRSASLRRGQGRPSQAPRSTTGGSGRAQRDRALVAVHPSVTSDDDRTDLLEPHA